MSSPRSCLQACRSIEQLFIKKQSGRSALRELVSSAFSCKEEVEKGRHNRDGQAVSEHAVSEARYSSSSSSSLLPSLVTESSKRLRATEAHYKKWLVSCSCKEILEQGRDDRDREAVSEHSVPEARVGEEKVGREGEGFRETHDSSHLPGGETKLIPTTYTSEKDSERENARVRDSKREQERGGNRRGR